MRKVIQDDILSLESVKTMVDLADIEVKALIGFLYLFGCRISEALQVKTDDLWVDENNRLNARIMVLKNKQLGRHVLKISMNSPFVDIILSYKAQKQAGELMWNFSQNLKSARVIAHRKIKKLNERAYPHLFRHTRLTKLAERGASPIQIQIWAGWSDITPADVYVRKSAQMIEDLADKIE